MSRPARVSRDVILKAAAVEFAERGYAGARVARISHRAGVNKAMIYYYFRSKESLYRTLLRQIFKHAGDRLQAIAASADPPSVKIDRALGVMTAFIRDNEYFPRIMLREIADGAAHLDRTTLSALSAVPRAVGAIVQQGISRKVFRPVHPLAAYLTMLAPVVVYLAGTQIRQELASQRLAGAATLTPGVFTRHMQEMMRRTLAATGATP